MAQLNFPDPADTQTYTEAGTTWTWNATLGVWSAEGSGGGGGGDFLVNNADDTTTGQLTAEGGFVGDLTGNADTADVATQINRQGITTSSSGVYRILMGLNSNTAGPSNAYVVTNDSRLHYRPDTSTLGGVTRFAGKADTCNITISTGSGLSGGGALTQNRTFTVDSTVLRTTGAQSKSGTMTFTSKVKFDGSSTICSSNNTKPSSSSKATYQWTGMDQNTVIGIGLSNKGAIFGNTNSSNWADVITFINGASSACGKVQCKASVEPRFAASSDRRLKADIRDAESMLEKFEQIQVRRFTVDHPETEGVTEDVLGFVADELQAVFPEAVDGDPDAMMTVGNIIGENGEVLSVDVEAPETGGYALEEGQVFAASRSEVPKYQTVSSSALIVPMAKAIQELIALNKQLQQRLDDAGIA